MDELACISERGGIVLSKGIMLEEFDDESFSEEVAETNCDESGKGISRGSRVDGLGFIPSIRNAIIIQ